MAGANVWGPAAWTWLHVVTFNYSLKPSSEERVRAHDFLTSFAHNVPCSECRDGFLMLVNQRLNGKGSQSDLFDSRWSFSIAACEWHNKVNEKLGKSIVPFGTLVGRYLARKPAGQESSCCD